MLCDFRCVGGVSVGPNGGGEKMGWNVVSVRCGSENGRIRPKVLQPLPLFPEVQACGILGVLWGLTGVLD